MDIVRSLFSYIKSRIAHDYEPLRLPEGRPLAQKLADFQARLRHDWPAQPLPPIYVLKSAPAWEFMRIKGYQEGIPFYWSGGNGLDQGIYMPQDRIEQFSDAQTLTIIAHELGHYYLGHAQAHFSRALRAEEVQAIRRSFECEADQFAGHYVRDAAEGMEYSLRAFRQGPLMHEPVAGASHPADTDRITNLKDEAAMSVKPGFVSFTPQCHAKLTSIAKALPGQLSEIVSPTAPAPQGPYPFPVWPSAREVLKVRR